MTELLTTLLATSSKSAALAVKDPYGLIMTLTAVVVVFSALLILYIFFGILGNAISGKFKKLIPKRKTQNIDEDTAAAIALAIEEEFSGEVYAAIALALDEELHARIHDKESYIITIKR